jgi:hypothetical protein
MDHLRTFVESLKGMHATVLMANDSVGMVTYEVEELEAELTFSFTMDHPFEIQARLLKSLIIPPDHPHSAAVDRELVNAAHRHPSLHVSRNPETGEISIRSAIPLAPSKAFLSEAHDQAIDFMSHTVTLVNGLIYAMKSGTTSHEVYTYIEKHVWGSKPTPPTDAAGE